MTKERIYLGIDPGRTGAFAAIYPDGDAIVWDIPTTTRLTGRKTAKGNRQKAVVFDYAGIVASLKPFADAHLDPDSGYSVDAVLENVHAFPKETPVTAFALGHCKGLLEGVMTVLGLPYVLVAPHSWRPFMVGAGAEKKASLARARLLYPRAELRLVKHGDRAEALLMADYRRRKQEDLPPPKFRRVEKIKRVKKTQARRKK